jgi:hypothetical protein
VLAPIETSWADGVDGLGARPIPKGKSRTPTEFDSVMQLAELWDNAHRGARK